MIFKSLIIISVIIFTADDNPLYAQSCEVCTLADEIDPLSIEKLVRELSGEDSVNVDGIMTLIKTRYALSEQKFTAMKHLINTVSALGYHPEIQKFPMTVSSPQLKGIALSSGMDTVWAGSAEGNIYMSTRNDGWEGFDLITTIGGNILELARGPGGRLFAACRIDGTPYGAVYSSGDGGVTWEMVYNGTFSKKYTLNTITFWDENFGFTAGDGGSFLRTSNGGNYWISEPDPSEFDYRSIYGSAATGPFHFWAVTSGFYLYESEDFGKTWTSVFRASVAIYDIDFYDEARGIIVGNGAVYRTLDGGETWIEATIGADLRSVVMADSVKVIASGGGGDIWISDDGGASWTGTGTECTGEKDVWSIAVTDSGRVWAAGLDEVTRVDYQEGIPAECMIYTFSDSSFGANIIFRLEGYSDPDHRVIICGHYDSFNNSDPFVIAPGADDNASGVASVLECARVLAGVAFEKTIEFILFDGEELGLFGSRIFAGNLDPSIVYEGVFNIDMVGNNYGDTPTISIGGYEGTLDTVLVDLLIEASDNFSRLYSLEWDFRGLTQPISDNISFKYIENIPAVLLIENGYADNPHYHSGSDLVDYMDFDYVADVARAVLGASAGLAGFISTSLSKDVVLHQNYPNPFFSSTRIQFELPRTLPVDLSVFDVSGRLIARLIDDTLGPDKIVYLWNGKNSSGNTLASGVYFIRLKAGPYSEVKKALIVR